MQPGLGQKKGHSFRFKQRMTVCLCQGIEGRAEFRVTLRGSDV